MAPLLPAQSRVSWDLRADAGVSGNAVDFPSTTRAGSVVVDKIISAVGL